MGTTLGTHRGATVAANVFERHTQLNRRWMSLGSVDNVNVGNTPERSRKSMVRGTRPECSPSEPPQGRLRQAALWVAGGCLCFVRSGLSATLRSWCADSV
jgi:hypothetical protein